MAASRAGQAYAVSHTPAAGSPHMLTATELPSVGGPDAEGWSPAANPHACSGAVTATWMLRMMPP